MHRRLLGRFSDGVIVNKILGLRWFRGCKVKKLRTTASRGQTVGKTLLAHGRVFAGRMICRAIWITKRWECEAVTATKNDEKKV